MAGRIASVAAARHDKPLGVVSASAKVATMIDHVSIAVSEITRSTLFYDRVLGCLGLTRMVDHPLTIGYGKRYPEFWINQRPGRAPTRPDSGVHVCIRAPGIKAVEEFYVTALDNGGVGDGEPGPRPDYGPTYFAAFVCDPDGNRIEAVTFVDLTAAG